MNIGIVGVRGYGRTYFRSLESRPDAQVVAVCDLDGAAAEQVAAASGVPHWFADFNDLLALPQVDAVFVATPHFLHHPMVMAALQAGKHVLCEKPLAIAPEHADEMARTARERGLTLTCHYNQRQTPYMKALRHLVQSGALGDVYQVNARWMARWTGFMFDARTSWRLNMDKSGGGILIGRGSHLIDAIWSALGRPVVEAISADLHFRLAGTQVDDFATATLRLAGGGRVCLQCSYVAHAAAFGDCLEYEAYGTEGGASFRKVDGEEAFAFGRTRMSDGAWEDRSAELDWEAIGAGRPTNVIHDFLDAVTAGHDPDVTGEDAAVVTHILAAGYESARTGHEVRIR